LRRTTPFALNRLILDTDPTEYEYGGQKREGPSAIKTGL
jgi:hypothetical protein